jgi:AcrR family transcriptional regulator
MPIRDSDPEPLAGNSLRFGNAQGDSQTSLPPIAYRLLEAARRLAVKRGYESITIERVASEARQYRASVSYYFGNKANLIEQLADFISARGSMSRVADEVQALPVGEDRLRAHIDALRSEVENQESFMAFFVLLPHMFLNENLRDKEIELYEWWLDLTVRMFGVDASDFSDGELRTLAGVVTACVDGLAIQACLDPARFDIRGSFEMLERLVKQFIWNDETKTEDEQIRHRQGDCEAAETQT